LSSAFPIRLLPWRSLAWLVVLNTLLQAPWALGGEYLPRLLVPMGELVVLALVVLAVQAPRARTVLIVCWAALFSIELDRLVGVLLMDQDPLFYDQLFLLRHFVVLLADLWDIWWTLGTLAVVAGLVGVFGMLRWAHRGLTGLSGLYRGWGLAVVASITVGLGLLPESIRPVRWVVPELVGNVDASIRTWRGVQNTLVDSPYQALDTVVLDRTPDVSFYIIESYGRIIATHDNTAPAWSARLDTLDQQLTDAGWHGASGWCTAPVSGGRSWLADGSMLLGMAIQHESVYRHVVSQVAPLPDLVEFFADRGYETLQVAPKLRERPGMPMTNDLLFGRQLTWANLDYSGPPIGWGWIPDQHTLGFLKENVLGDGPPRFMLFHMVSAHIPWEVPPPILDDWRLLSSLDDDLDAVSQIQDKPASDEARRALKLYRRSDAHVRRGPANDITIGAYAQAIHYDIDVLERHLIDPVHRDSLVIVMGDHQPPLVNRRASKDVPVHLLARDPAVLAEFIEQGFTPGLSLAPTAPATVRHEGLYSLIVRALARCCGEGPLPDYRPEGAPTLSD